MYHNLFYGHIVMGILQNQKVSEYNMHVCVCALDSQWLAIIPLALLSCWNLHLSSGSLLTPKWPFWTRLSTRQNRTSIATIPVSHLLLPLNNHLQRPQRNCIIPSPTTSCHPTNLATTSCLKSKNSNLKWRHPQVKQRVWAWTTPVSIALQAGEQ